MAQFTAQGRLKPLFIGDATYVGSETKDPSHRRRFKVLIGSGSDGGLRFVENPPIPLHYKRKLGFLIGSDRTRLFVSSSSSSSTHKSKKLTEKASSNVGKDKIVGEILEEDLEFEADELACFRGLVLDISYRPVNIVCWKRAICLEFMEKADVLEYYDQTVNSPSGSFYIPAVLRIPHLLQVVKRRKIQRNLSRKNIFYRDGFTCQYCSSADNLTVDHILPIARGGKWTWENLVTACAKCNSRKGQKTLEEANMKLNKVPKAPKDFDILAIPMTSTAIKMLKMRNGTPEEWQQYLSKPPSQP